MLRSSGTTMPSMPSAILLLVSAIFAFLHATSGATVRHGPEAGPQPVGVCYGTFSTSQPSAQEAVSLVQSVGIKRIRLYGPDHNALQTLKNTGIEVVLGVPNNELQWVAASQDNADQWIQGNVKNYQDVNFRYIVVGNGVSPYEFTGTPQLAPFLFPAMQNIQNSLSSSAQFNHIPVTTAIDQSVALSQTFPPSKANLNPQFQQFFNPIISFLVKHKNPLLVNLHPYDSYTYNKPEIPRNLQKGTTTSQDPRLQYVTFQSQSPVVQDGPLAYTNVFDVMVDGVYSALEKANGPSLDVVVSEIGWPTAGGGGATNFFAATHNNNLINHVRKAGTPKRPQKFIETYIFSLFDEDKRGDNKHWGIFLNNKQAKYQINFKSQ
ncbi:glucan endo-1,3-beta-glucosidase, basic isoform-like [Apium graveolens]|uniref:glucan endo-1,3-beta-glucosidase, basic isoform-like n=1 Tax=Apium graveolens TaxID=4045 RepID=UPI003D794658